jgi:hypothetical protein
MCYKLERREKISPNQISFNGFYPLTFYIPEYANETNKYYLINFKSFKNIVA